MKKILFILLFAGCAATASAQVKFETKPTDAIHQIAEKEGKLVFIDLYAPWCPPCRTMDKEVFSRTDVGEFMNKRFVNAKYNIDESIGKDFMSKYKLRGIPAYLIFNLQGELIGSITGASDAQRFMADVEKIIAGKQPGK